jgi:hypothetical protein
LEIFLCGFKEDVAETSGDEGAKEFTRPLGDVVFLSQCDEDGLGKPPESCNGDIKKAENDICTLQNDSKSMRIESGRENL